MTWRRRQVLQAATALGVFALQPGASAASRSEREASRKYLLSLRNADGGFRTAAAEGPSQLMATVGILRGVRYWGGKVPERERTISWVSQCYHPSLGAFSDSPTSTPDIRSTALGLMALAELKAPLDRFSRDTLRYLEANATSLPDMYFAAAALEATGLESPAAGRFVMAFDATEKPDGSFGPNAYQAAGAAITLLRLGKGPSHPDIVAEGLMATQQADGGFRGPGQSQESDLGGVYRIVRALYMLHAKPDRRSLRRFIAKCRNADGGYGPAPGKPSTGPTTYYAGIVSHWLERMDGW
jgi:prenyltransferase beta subunit